MNDEQKKRIQTSPETVRRQPANVQNTVSGARWPLWWKLSLGFAALMFLNILNGGAKNQTPVADAAPTRPVPDCSLSADIAAAIRAGSQQEMSRLSLDATGVTLQLARFSEQNINALFGPREVRAVVLKTCQNEFR